MAGFFDLPSARSTTKKDRKLLNKSKPKTVSKSNTITLKGGGTLADKIQTIVTLVKQKFDGKEDTFLVIRDEESFINYIDKCIENGVISIDTETTGLDTMLDEIVGLCVYTPGMKAAYVPINHVSYITGAKVENQLPIDFIKEQLDRLNEHNVKTIWFNADFDVRFIGNKIGCWLKIYFDTSIASRSLNSAEPKGSKGLKALHKKYCRNNEGEAYSFDKLFEGIPFNLIPINVAYLYAANDAIITYELYLFQAQYLEPTGKFYEEKGMQQLSWNFFNVEMASMPTFIEMEQTGVAIDFEHAKKISEKYHKLAESMNERLVKLCDMYSDEINSYRRSVPNCKLSDPINLDSPVQLSILLYDILKIEPPDKKNPRGTGAEILEKIKHPLCTAILDVRSFNKAISTYVDKLPTLAHKDGRIHCRFNQYGADTGRVSSDSPNLQNIPSNPFILSDGTKVDAGKDIRQFFTATDGYVILSCDYSGQEVRVTAHLSNDEKMIKAYEDGKDVYVEIASLAFGVPYEDCLEERPDGTKNPEGKERRGAAKKIVLGVLYGRGIPSIAEQLGVSVSEAQSIYDTVLEKFEGLAQFIEDSEDMARELGYVDTIWGRRRQLPDMQLPQFEFNYKDGITPDFDPLSDDFDEELSTEVPLELVKKYTNQLLNCRSYKQKERIKEQIRSNGITIKDNGAYIAQAQRQCVNARVQGSSADLTKLAQILIYNNKELRDLGFRMLIPVHDEILAECPKENVKRCAELMSELMLYAGKDLCVPLSCDTEVFNSWYGPKLDIETLEPVGKK